MSNKFFVEKLTGDGWKNFEGPLASMADGLAALFIAGSGRPTRLRADSGLIVAERDPDCPNITVLKTPKKLRGYTHVW